MITVFPFASASQISVLRVLSASERELRADAGAPTTCPARTEARRGFSITAGVPVVAPPTC